MLFNSFEFLLFLPIVFCIYWFLLKNYFKGQNLVIVFASYIFYGCWDWRFLSLIFFSTVVDYTIGLSLLKAHNPQKRKILLWASILVNIGLLGVFKYYNFFVESLVELFILLGLHLNYDTLNIVLPVGISFYTFQTLSYTIDVYKGKLQPTQDFIAFSAYVSFFPQLVAGPIERATNLLPQFLRKRKFNYIFAIDGIRQMLWGLFMKVVIADNCAVYVNQIFGSSDQLEGSTLLLGGLFFTFQIYGDFAGYSNIAIGTARLFGFNLMQNFAFPYFSRDIAEFWRRWHISLSTWFRDYVYVPLGGSRGNTAQKIRNTFIIFLVSGLWHGANWTFIVWGALNALYFLPLLLLGKNRRNLGIIGASRPAGISEYIQMFGTFILTVFAWIFFRAKNLEHAFTYIGGIFSNTIFSIPSILPIDVLLILTLFVIVEWMGRKSKYAIQHFGRNAHPIINWGLMYVVVFSIYLLGNFESQYEFIYFQF